MITADPSLFTISASENRLADTFALLPCRWPWSGNNEDVLDVADV